MPDDRLAESIVALVAPRDRAASVIGDLMEDVPRRGTTWFWLSVWWTVAAFVWHDCTRTPVRLAAAAAVGWFWYMLVAVIVLPITYVVVTFAWIVFSFLTHHTGLELLTDLVRLRVAWPPAPAWVPALCDTAAMMVLAPFYIGRIVAIERKQRAVAFSVMLALVWSVLVTFVPFVSMFGGRLTLAMMPGVAVFLLAGVVRARLTQLQQPG